ncbi:hypothetical protein KQX54_007556, partial [Cotesia glomerata]
GSIVELQENEEGGGFEPPTIHKRSIPLFLLPLFEFTVGVGVGIAVRKDYRPPVIQMYAKCTGCTIALSSPLVPTQMREREMVNSKFENQVCCICVGGSGRIRMSMWVKVERIG